MSLFNLVVEAANGFLVLFLVLFLIGIVLLISYSVGSLLVFIFLNVPSIPVEKGVGCIEFRGSPSWLGYFNPDFGEGMFGLLVVLVAIGLIVSFLAAIGVLAESVGVSFV